MSITFLCVFGLSCMTGISLVYVLCGVIVFQVVLDHWRRYTLLSSSPSPSRSDKCAILVTGGSSGLGEAMAMALARGGNLVIASVRKEEDAARLTKQHALIQPVLMDVADRSSVKAAYAAVEKVLTRHDARLVAVVNNAGVGGLMAAELQSPASAQQLIHTNVLGVLAVTQTFLPLLLRSNSSSSSSSSSSSPSTSFSPVPRILFVGSVAAITTPPYMGLYAASKKSVEALADAFLLELMPHNVCVSLFEVGTFKTLIQQKAFASVTDELEGLPADRVARYPSLVRISQGYEDVRKGTSHISEFTDAIEHAIFSPRPYVRYRCGSARGIPPLLLQWLHVLMPDLMMDFIKNGRKSGSGKSDFLWIASVVAVLDAVTTALYGASWNSLSFFPAQTSIPATFLSTHLVTGLTGLWSRLVAIIARQRGPTVAAEDAFGVVVTTLLLVVAAHGVVPRVLSTLLRYDHA